MSPPSGRWGPSVKDWGMATPIPAGRVEATRRRLAELRDRIDRLRAGEASTGMDVERARSAAREQRVAATEAYLRLLRTRAWAASRARAVTGLDLSPSISPEHQELARLVEQNRRLRDALVAIQTYSAPSGPDTSEDRRRSVWEALVDECRSEDWRSWALAVCVVATRLPAVRGAALTLYDQHQVAYPLAASDRWTRDVDDIHQIVGEGPALQVGDTRPVLVVDNIADAYSRWPGFVEAAASAGLRGLACFYVPVGVGITGSLTLYRTVAQPHSETYARDAALLAEVAASAVLADVDALNDDPDRVYPDEYQNVNIAAGMLSIRLTISVAEAYLRIRAHAYGSGRSLSDTAKSVIDGTFRQS